MHGSGREPTISRGCACTMSLPSSSCIPPPPPQSGSSVQGVGILWLISSPGTSVNSAVLESQNLVIYSPHQVWDGHVTYTERVILLPKMGKGTSGLFQMDTFEMEFWGKRERERFKEDIWREEEMPFSHILIPYQGERQGTKQNKTLFLNMLRFGCVKDRGRGRKRERREREFR